MRGNQMAFASLLNELRVLQGNVSARFDSRTVGKTWSRARLYYRTARDLFEGDNRDTTQVRFRRGSTYCNIISIKPTTVTLPYHSYP
jgi:hypothetical protein